MSAKHIRGIVTASPRMRHGDISENVNVVSGDVIDACHEVYRHLGPGLLESVYKEALIEELGLRGRFVVRNRPVPIIYKGKHLRHPLQLDLLVDDVVLVELKSVEDLHPVHYAQTRSYLRLTGVPVGILVNFNSARLKDATHRVVPPRPPSEPPLSDPPKRG